MRKEDEEKRKVMNEWMTDDGIGVNGVKAMSKMLKVNTTFTSLNLRGKEERMKQEWKEINE